TGMLVGVWGALWASGGALANEAPKRGGTLNFAVVPEPPTADCHATTTFAMVHPVAPQYSTLLAFVGPRDNIKIEGDLAQSWEIAKDGLSDTFKQRKGRVSTTAPTSRPRMSGPLTSASSTLRRVWFAHAGPSTRTSRRSRRPTLTRWSSRWRG